MKHVKRTIRYPVRKAEVRLAITIGQGQVGSSIVRRGDKELASGGSMLSISLGPGESLLDTEIEVSSLVQDVLTETNRVIVQYVLSGGPKKETVVSKTTVDNQFDVARFTTTIRFVAP